MRFMIKLSTDSRCFGYGARSFCVFWWGKFFTDNLHIKDELSTFALVLVHHKIYCHYHYQLTIMLNVDLIDSLYNSLPSSRQKVLLTMLFNKTDQTMEYFRNKKDIGFSKLEILADFFHKPLEYFRQDSNFMADDSNYGNNMIFGLSLSAVRSEHIPSPDALSSLWRRLSNHAV